MFTKRLLYVITGSECGGAQVHLLQLIAAFRAYFDVGVVVGDEGFLTGEARKLEVPVFVEPALSHRFSPRHNLRAISRLRSIMNAFSADLVHAHSSKAGILGRAAAYRAGLPCVFTPHGWSFTQGVNGWQKTLAIPSEALAAQFCHSIISVSKYDAALAVRHHIAPASKITVIQNGISDTKLQAQPGNGGEIKICMVARFDKQKDQALLLEALRDLDLRFRLTLVGDGPLLTKVKADAVQWGLIRKVEFLGTRNDIDKLLAESHICALASKYEGLPISILEGMRAGLPVVASAVGGVRECVQHGRTGFVVPAGDVGMLRAYLRLLIESSALRVRLGAAGRKLYQANFTEDHMLAQTLKVYETALNLGTIGEMAPARGAVA